MSHSKITATVFSGALSAIRPRRSQSTLEATLLGPSTRRQPFNPHGGQPTRCRHPESNQRCRDRRSPTPKDTGAQGASEPVSRPSRRAASQGAERLDTGGARTQRPAHHRHSRQLRCRHNRQSFCVRAHARPSSPASRVSCDRDASRRSQNPPGRDGSERGTTSDCGRINTDF